jgi:hypothetical protein
MASRRRAAQEAPPPAPVGRPATTPEGRENQLIAAAVNLAERQLRDGTAAAQVITHYLKLGSTRESLEQEKLRKENDLLEARHRCNAFLLWTTAAGVGGSGCGRGRILSCPDLPPSKNGSVISISAGKSVTQRSVMIGGSIKDSIVLESGGKFAITS